MNNKRPVNVPFEKHEVADYERKRYRGLDQRIVHGRETRILRKMLRRIRRETDDDSLRALDLPCGYGRFSHLLQEEGFSPLNSDLSLSMVERAGEKHAGLGKIPGVVADAKQGLPFERDAFFLLFSMRFFHHLHNKSDREAILREFSRVTSRWVILSFYKRNSLHVLQRKLRRRVMKKKTRIKMVPRKEFYQEIRDAGLNIIKVSPLFRGIHAHHVALLKKN